MEIIVRVTVVGLLARIVAAYVSIVVFTRIYLIHNVIQILIFIQICTLCYSCLRLALCIQAHQTTYVCTC